MIKYNEPLRNHSTIDIGGNADIFSIPDSESDLKEILMRYRNFPVFILGNGSNTLFTDNGYRGVVIQMKDNFNQIKAEGTTISVSADVLISDLVSFCISHKLRGIECMAGIPGTIGGAVYMNAGYTKPISTILEKVRCIDYTGKEKWLNNKEMNFGHRSSIFHNKKNIILEAVLKLTEGDCAKTVKSYLEKRSQAQPVHMKSLGTVFIKNNLKEYQGIISGGAKIIGSYIVNQKDATAADVIHLIKKTQGASKLEIEIVGE